MKIFIFTNKIQNYVSGQYYFIAMDRSQAEVMAHKFKTDKNKNCPRAYMIDWDDDVVDFPVKPGYVPLNRIETGSDF